MPAYSVLDLSPILEGGDAGQSFANTLDLARQAEALGYTRYWLAEHHNIPGVASAATSILIGQVAAVTRTMRVGSGGIMLPNHAPLVIAEQFGTLESLFPGRIDLGLGRAPGGDGKTARALRRNLGSNGDTFPQDLLELQAYLNRGFNGVRAVPGHGTHVPIHLLGSSDFSARLAAELGLPFAFASHFAPDYLPIAIDLYRKLFKPSEQLSEPHVTVAVNVFAADTDEQGHRLMTSLYQAFLGIVRGLRGQLPPPTEALDWNPAERDHVLRMTRVSAVGSLASVTAQLQTLLEETDADELIFASQIFDHDARLRSYEIAAEAMQAITSFCAVETHA